MSKIVVTLVSGNTSWWKQRKYRRETAQRLRRLRAVGWKLAGFERLASAGVDTRTRTAYHLIRPDLGTGVAPAAASSRSCAGSTEHGREDAIVGESSAIS